MKYSTQTMRRAPSAVWIVAAITAACADSNGGGTPPADVSLRCVLPSDCGRGFYCSPAGMCTNECREDRDCITSVNGPVCALNEGRCVAADASTPRDLPPDSDDTDASTDLPTPPEDSAADVVVLDAAPDVAVLDAAPDVAAPDVAAPDVAAPDVAAPDVAAPDVAELDAAPDVAELDAAPDVAELDAAPDVAAPDVAVLDTAPDVAAPDVATPDASVCMSPPLPVTDSLWAHYSFDGDVADDSGLRRHGTIHGPVRFSASPACQAAELGAGAGAYIDLPDAHFFTVTVAARARADAQGSLFDGWTRSENVLLHAVMLDGVLHWSARFHDRPDTSHQYREIWVDAPARPGAWQHVAATYDGRTLRLYVDGVLQGSAETNRGAFYAATSGDPDLRVGINRDGVGWRGAVDDLAVYERALSAREVALLAGCTGGSCDVVCPAGQHRCDGVCVSDAAVATCGARCTPCPTLPSSTVRCDGSACRYEVTLQPGPGVATDIWTTSVYSFAPGGSGPGGGRDDDILKVGGWGDTYLSLLRFNLSELPPSPSSATLELYCYADNGARTTPIWVDRITGPWDWRTSGTGRDRERLWWADRPPTTPWRMVAAPVVGSWQQIDVLPLVSEWLSGTTPNHGLQLRPVNTDNSFNFYYSGDTIAEATRRPRLLIRY